MDEEKKALLEEAPRDPALEEAPPLSLTYPQTKSALYTTLRYLSESAGGRGLRRMTLLGGIVLLGAVVLLVVGGIKGALGDVKLWLLAGIALAFAIYCLLFQRVFYPRMLKKETERAYRQLGFDGRMITLTLYSDRMECSVGGETLTLPWEEMAEAGEEDGFLFIREDLTTCTVVEDASLSPEDYARLRQVLQEVCTAHKKPFIAFRP